MEPFAYVEDASLGLIGVTANTIISIALLNREVGDIDIVVNPPRP